MTRRRVLDFRIRILNWGLILIVSFLLTFVEGFRLWVLWDQGRLRLPFHLMSIVNLFLGPILFAGLWKQNKVAYGLGAAILIGNAVNLFFVGETPSDSFARFLLKLTLYLFAAWNVWRIRPKSIDEIARDFGQRICEAVARNDARKSFPKGKMSIRLRSEMVPIRFEWLQRCMSLATGRECRLENDVVNFDLCAESSRLREDESYVGGAGKLAVLAVNNFKMQMYSTTPTASPLESESNPAGLLVFDRLVASGIDRCSLNGLNWLVPVAIAMWSDQVQEVLIDDVEGTRIEFSSQDDLIQYAISNKCDGFGTLAALAEEFAPRGPLEG